MYGNVSIIGVSVWLLVGWFGVWLVRVWLQYGVELVCVCEREKWQKVEGGRVVCIQEAYYYGSDSNTKVMNTYVDVLT